MLLQYRTEFVSFDQLAEFQEVSLKLFFKDIPAENYAFSAFLRFDPLFYLG